MDYLEDVKIRLNITDDSKDNLLLSYINQTIEKIKNYINRPEVPDGLFFTVVAIAIDLYNLNNIEDRKVTEEKQGNRSMKYTSKLDVDGVVSSYKTELNKFRRIRVW
jgi:hypothetical protein